MSLGSTTAQIIEKHGADALVSLMSLGNVSELESEIDRRLRRDGFTTNADGVWCELQLGGQSLRIGGLK